MTSKIIPCLLAVVGCTTTPPAQGAPDVYPPPVVQAPVVACTPAPADAGCDDGGDAACDGGPTYWYDKCLLPPSVCADSHWAAYFDDGTCVSGTCELVTKYHYCDTGCSNGGCISNGITAPSRGF